MNKIMIIAFIVILTTVVGITLLIYYRENQPYEENYFGKAGITGSFFYNDVIASKGIPLKEEVISNEKNGIWKSCYYDGYVLTFAKHQDMDDKDNFLQNVVITDVNYILGRYNIGIGSNLEDVKKAYKGKKQIVDIKNGYIEGSIWIEFEFNDYYKVNKIKIYVGP